MDHLRNADRLQNRKKLRHGSRSPANMKYYFHKSLLLAFYQNANSKMTSKNISKEREIQAAHVHGVKK